jgi:hypothetical protein
VESQGLRELVNVSILDTGEKLAMLNQQIVELAELSAHRADRHQALPIAESDVET